jgi:4'-phosphopantetheinyl transferase
MHAEHWPTPPTHPSLAPAEIHIWRAPLDLPAATLRHLRATLSADEQQRADRLLLAHVRDHFIAARGTLRALLARYLNTAPALLQFAYGERGKPSLAAPGDLRFNLSHSHGLALYAVARQHDLGIDLERIKPDIDYDGIARRYFAPAEYAALCALPPAEHLRAFFGCWVGKEAYLKAHGAGLWQSLDSFAVPLLTGGPLPPTTPDAPHYSLYRLTAHPDYAAAVVVAGAGWHLRCWQWPAPHACTDRT